MEYLEYIFDYDDIEPEKEVKENKRKFFILSDIIDKPFDFKTILAVILLFSYVFTMTTILLSDRSIGLKILGSAIDTYVILWTYMAIYMF